MKYMYYILQKAEQFSTWIFKNQQSTSKAVQMHCQQIYTQNLQEYPYFQNI